MYNDSTLRKLKWNCLLSRPEFDFFLSELPFTYLARLHHFKAMFLQKQTAPNTHSYTHAHNHQLPFYYLLPTQGLWQSYQYPEGRQLCRYGSAVKEKNFLPGCKFILVRAEAFFAGYRRANGVIKIVSLSRLAENLPSVLARFRLTNTEDPIHKDRHHFWHNWP